MNQNTFFTRKLLAASICAAAGGMMALPAFAQSAGPIEEVIVTGSFRDSLANALNIKRNNTVAMDSIVAEDIGEFPDNNLAESMQRIPGVNIERVGGEGKQISVRGLSPQFTRVRVNGMETIATGGGNGTRAFDFNIFASELFSRIDVRKTQSAEVDEGSLGATVDLSTGRPLDFDHGTFVASFQQGYNDLSESFDPRGSALFSVKSDDGTLGALFSISYSERNVDQVGHNSGRWEANNPSHDGTDPDRTNHWANVDTLPAEVNNATHPRFPRQMDRNTSLDRLGLTSSIQWQPTYETLVTLDGLYAKINNQLTESILTPISLSRTNSTGRKETSVNAWEIDQNNAMIYGDLSGVDIRSEHFEQKWTTEFYQLSLSVEHEFTDRLRVNGLVGSSKSTNEMKQDATAIFEIFNTDMIYDYRNGYANPTISYGFDTEDPNSWLISEMRDRPAETNNSFNTVAANVAFDINDVLTLKSGFSWKEFEFDYYMARRDRSLINPNDHVNPQLSVPAGCGLTMADLQVDSSMGGIWNATGGAPNFFRPDVHKVAAHTGLFTDDVCFPLVKDVGSDRGVKEEDTGVYVQLDFNTELAGLPFRGDVGVRYVETQQTSRGVRLETIDVGGNQETVENVMVVDRDYSDTLPALNLVLEATDDVLLRASWSKVMTRPDLNSLTPGGSVDLYRREVTVGNPYIDAFRADSLDLSVEWYFADEAMLSLAYFRKDIESFSSSTNEPVYWENLGPDFPDSLLGNGPAVPTDLFTYRTTVNGGGGELDGWEIQYQQPLTFLPGPDWLRNFGIKANYTYIESKVDFGTDTDGNTIWGTLDGQSKVSWNTTLWYENDAGFSGRVSWSYRDPYQRRAQTAVSNAPGPDRTDATRVVDAALSYQLNDNLKLSLEAINLTNEAETLLLSDYNMVETTLKSGRQFYLGVQYSF